MTPLEGHMHDGAMAGGMGWMAPIMGSLFAVVMFLTAIAAWKAWRNRGQLSGWLGRARLANPMSPEHKAREILATRFANGEIDSQEFMERSSMLNWTPGVEPKAPSKR